MAVQELIILNSGNQLTRYTPATSSSGASSAGATVALNTSGQIDPTMLPASNGLPTISLPATEAIAAGALVNIWSSSGVASIRNANATDGTKPAHGFCAAAVASGANGTVQFAGAMNSGASGLTIGSPVFLGATAGTATTTAPSAAGQYLQQVGGVAISATEYLFAPQIGVVL